MFDREEDDILIYHSKCIFDSIPDNKKQVTLFIKKNGTVNINCFHDKCKLHNKYFFVKESLNKNLYAFIMLNNKDMFETIDGDINNLFSYMFEKDLKQIKEGDK